MPKIYFTSGKTLEITEYEFERISPKLQMGGIRLYRTAKGNLIPLNSTTIELIEKESTGGGFEKTLETWEEKAEKVPLKDIKPEPKEKEVQTIAEEPEEPEEKVESAKPETPQEKQDRMMAELIEKSECLHPRDRLQMMYQETKSGRRYFPVCTFCGYRHRYISIKKVKAGTIDWTMDEVVAAKPWIEKK